MKLFQCFVLFVDKKTVLLRSVKPTRVDSAVGPDLYLNIYPDCLPADWVKENIFWLGHGAVFV